LVVPGVTEEVGAFLRCKVIEEFAYTIPEGIDGALGGFRKRQIKAIAALLPKKQVIQQKLQELKQSGADRWERAKADLEARIAEFEKSVKGIESKAKAK